MSKEEEEIEAFIDRITTQFDDISNLTPNQYQNKYKMTSDIALEHMLYRVEEELDKSTNDNITKQLENLSAKIIEPLYAQIKKPLAISPPKLPERQYNLQPFEPTLYKSLEERISKLTDNFDFLAKREKLGKQQPGYRNYLQTELKETLEDIQHFQQNFSDHKDIEILGNIKEQLQALNEKITKKEPITESDIDNLKTSQQENSTSQRPPAPPPPGQRPQAPLPGQASRPPAPLPEQRPETHLAENSIDSNPYTDPDKLDSEYTDPDELESSEYTDPNKFMEESHNPESEYVYSTQTDGKDPIYEDMSDANRPPYIEPTIPLERSSPILTNKDRPQGTKPRPPAPLPGQRPFQITTPEHSTPQTEQNVSVMPKSTIDPNNPPTRNSSTTPTRNSDP